MIDPAIDIGDLPPLDLVELSHFHSDHFDLVAERDPGKSMPITTTPEAAKELTEREFNNSCPIDAWTSATVANGDIRLRVTALPGRHGPPLSQVVMPEVMGSMLEFLAPGRPPLIRIYITGDTLVIDEMHGIARRYPNIDLGLLHLGGTEALGIMVTMDGEHGTQALKIVNPKRAIPIQFNDNDAFKSLLSDFQRAVTDAGL